MAGLLSLHRQPQLMLRSSWATLALVGQPAGDWVRIRWTEFAARLGTSLDNQEFPPCFTWFPQESWPASMERPPEGSLDEISLEALMPHLCAPSAFDECVAAYGLVTGRALDGAVRCFRGPISRLREMIDRSEWRLGSPSNIWPMDRSWFVYTDWELWARR